MRTPDPDLCTLYFVLLYLPTYCTYCLEVPPMYLPVQVIPTLNAITTCTSYIGRYLEVLLAKFQNNIPWDNTQYFNTRQIKPVVQSLFVLLLI